VLRIRWMMQTPAVNLRMKRALEAPILRHGGVRRGVRFARELGG